VAALEIGGDAAEAVQQRGEIAVDEVALEEADELVALDEAAAQAHVHQADDVLPAEGFDPAAELFQIAGRSDGADEGADGAAADDLRLDALPRQRPQHPHMRPAPGGAAAEGDADAGVRFMGASSWGLVVAGTIGRLLRPAVDSMRGALRGRVVGATEVVPTRTADIRRLVPQQTAS
jgi:hypothetical protein